MAVVVRGVVIQLATKPTRSHRGSAFVFAGPSANPCTCV